MNKAELIERVHRKMNLGKSAVEQVINSALEATQAALATGEEVVLTGFGKFQVNKSAAREGRNPKTGEVITIPAGRRVAFKPGKTLKEAVNVQ
jgi:DNA-binding protein HU-beta